jgi:tol-pal system protein YbgF
MVKDKELKFSFLSIPLFLTLVFLFIFPAKVFGGFSTGITENEGITLLKGEKRPYLFFLYSENIDSDFRSQIEYDITLRIKIIGQEPKEFKRGHHSYLAINLNALKEDGNRYSGHIEISFNKVATFAKENIVTYAVVWSDGFIFSNARKDYIRQCVKDIFNKFLNVYLKANHRKYVPIDKENRWESSSNELELYDDALATFRKEGFQQAMDGFRQFLKEFPKSDRADNAQFWIGECFKAQKEYDKAILAYQQVIENYPKGNKVPAAMLRQAITFLEIKEEKSYRLLLKKVIKEYPDSDEAKIAKAKLRN